MMEPFIIPVLLGGDIILGACMDNKCVVIKSRHCSVVGWNIFHGARNRRAKESRLASTLGVSHPA